VSTGGQSYSSLPNAFRYRQEFNASCSCRRPGESWADALKSVEDTTVERGDIIVTEENAKALSQPGMRPAKQSTKATKPDPRTQSAAGNAVDAAAMPTPVNSAPLPDAAAPAPAPAAVASPDPKRSIRTVGPPFIVR